MATSGEKTPKSIRGARYATGLAAILLLSIAARAGATEYWVTTTGEDANPGTSASPWRTLQKAVNTVVAGDTVNIGDGQWQEHLMIAQSGSSSAPITFRAAPGATPILDGASFTGGKYDTIVGISGASNLVIDGLTLRNSPGFGVSVVGDSRNVRLLNLDIHHCNGPGALWIEGSVSPSYSEIHGCKVHDNEGGGITFWQGSGYYLVEENEVWNNRGVQNFDGIQVGSQVDGFNHVAVRRNLVYDNGAGDPGADNIDMGGHGPCDHYLMEGNTARGSNGSVKMHGMPPTATVARFNRITGQGITEYDHPNPAMIYSNTIVDARNALQFHSDDVIGGPGTDFGGLEARNNLFVASTNYTLILTGASGFKIDTRYSSIRLDGNLYQFGSGGILWSSGIYSAQLPDPDGATAFAAYQAANPPDLQDVRSHRTTADPTSIFVDYANRDYHLAPGSPAIDGGVELTRTTTAGTSSTRIRVVRASFFHDSYDGLIAPDWVVVGSNAAVQVVSIDDAANEITVATPISWSAGDPVNLPYEGTAPDNGAFESASTGPSAPKLLKVEPLPS